MKFLIIAMMVMCFNIVSVAQQSISDRINALIPILITVESNGREKVVGDSGKAKGVLQIHEIYVKDVNRIYKTAFSHDDTFDRNKAIIITRLYLTHYGKCYEQKTGNTATFEVLSRIHNGGPIGYLKKSTDKHWNKISLLI